MLLQRADADLASNHRLDPLNGGAEPLHSGDAGNSLGDGRRADLVPVKASPTP